MSRLISLFASTEMQKFGTSESGDAMENIFRRNNNISSGSFIMIFWFVNSPSIWSEYGERFHAGSLST